MPPQCPAAVQEDYAGAAVNSGVLACRPNHPVWEHAFTIMEERKGESGRAGSWCRGCNVVGAVGAAP